MFNRIHNRKRKFLLLLRAGDGRFIRNAIVLLASFVLCALANTLFHFVLELATHRTGTLYTHEPLSPARVGQLLLMLFAAMAPLIEEAVFRFSRWFNRLLFSVLAFFAVFLLTESLPVKHNSADAWIYLQTAIAWCVAATIYLIAGAMVLNPYRGARVRVIAYILAGLLAIAGIWR